MCIYDIQSGIWTLIHASHLAALSCWRPHLCLHGYLHQLFPVRMQNTLKVQVLDLETL